MISKSERSKHGKSARKRYMCVMMLKLLLYKKKKNKMKIYHCCGTHPRPGDALFISMASFVCLLIHPKTRHETIPFLGP